MITNAKGKVIDVFNLVEDDISIDDIVLALPNICRYGGRIAQHYCVTPETRILTSDLKWSNAGDLKLEDELLAFEEYRTTNKYRNIINSRITHDGLIKKECFKITLEDGQVITCSAEHKFLATKVISKRNILWVSAKEIFDRVNNLQNIWLPKFLEPCSYLNNFDSGYISAIFDGEGHISIGTDNNSRRGVQMGFAQNKGIVLDKCLSILDKYNIQYSTYPHSQNDVINIQLTGGINKILQALIQFNPIRLSSNFITALKNNSLNQSFKSLYFNKVVACEYVGPQYVVALSTTSKTYITEGYASHNSVAQHAVELARWLRKNGKQELVPHALLHDACEAYIGDVIYPIKIRIPKFLELEIEITNVIYSKYGVDPKLQDIFDYYDKGISINEMKAIGIYEREVKFASHIKELDGLNIKLMNADTARVEYINELEEYFGNEILRD